MTHEPGLAEMLWELAERGWKPVLYPDTHLTDHREVLAWVCYPMGEVRAWRSARAADPVAAVREIWKWAQNYPNTPATPLPPRQPIATVGERRDGADPGQPLGAFSAARPEQIERETSSAAARLDSTATERRTFTRTATRLGYPAAACIEVKHLLRSFLLPRRLLGDGR